MFNDPDEPAQNFGICGEGARLDFDMHNQGDDLILRYFSPPPLTREQVEELQKAMEYGGAEFAAELIVECRRLGNFANDPNLPPPIDPHKLND